MFHVHKYLSINNKTDIFWRNIYLIEKKKKNSRFRVGFGAGSVISRHGSGIHIKRVRNIVSKLHN